MFMNISLYDIFTSINGYLLKVYNYIYNVYNYVYNAYIVI